MDKSVITITIMTVITLLRQMYLLKVVFTVNGDL